jgi:hypothetical protein
MPGQTQSRTLELLRVAGTHREVGEQIGVACSDAIRRRCDAVGDATIAAAQAYLEVTRRELPWLVDELDGVADAAGVGRGALFAAGIEELDEAPAPEPAVAVPTWWRARPPAPTAASGWPTRTTCPHRPSRI